MENLGCIGEPAPGIVNRDGWAEGKLCCNGLEEPVLELNDNPADGDVEDVREKTEKKLSERILLIECERNRKGTGANFPNTGVSGLKVKKKKALLRELKPRCQYFVSIDG